jgi:aryl-alcohol dehydrogenase-like predicted oxidoreductase
MKLRRLGSSDILISPVIMGTWQAGRDMWAGIEDRESVRAIQAALDAGITTIDTAAVYGKGHSEQMVARAVKGLRQEVVLATKVFANDLAPERVAAACHRSLRNLQTDYVDLYQIHWPAGSFGTKAVPIEETMAALTRLKAEGKIRAIGVSNFSRDQLAAALACGEVVSLQPPYSLFWRQVEADAAPLCREQGLSILAYSPMAQGLLTGKIGPGHAFAPGDHRSAHRLLQPEHFARVQTALEALKPLAARHGATLGQLALAWVLAQPNTCAIAGARSAEQVRENARAADIRLSPADLEEMDRIGRTVTDALDDNPVQWQW